MRPVARVARPARRIALPGLGVQRMSSGQDGVIVTGVALLRAHVADGAMAMLHVVPTHELGRPGSGLVQAGEALGRELGPVLGGAEQRLGIGVVIAHAGPGVRGLDAQPLQHGQHRRGFERGAVVAMQHGLGVRCGDALGQRRAAHQVHGMVGVVTVVDLGAHDLAAVQVQDQVQVEPAAHHVGRQVRHVPAPDLAGCRGDVSGGRTRGLGRLGTATPGALPVGFEYAGHAGLAAQVHAFVGQHGHDARRRHRGKARLVGHGQQRSAFIWAQRMAGCGTHRLRPAIACQSALWARLGLPALQRAHIDASDLAGRLQPRTVGVCGRYVLGQGLAIFEADHSSSPLLKIAATFFDSTSRAAVSASARSLRSRSRSSSLMRLRSARVACGLARASSGSASALVQLARHLSSSAGYTPCSRHQALLAASFIAAVVITASNRAPAVQARPRAGLDCASSRQRCRVPAPTPTSRATTSSAALSGGSNLATALSLNACPYRAKSVLHRRPLGSSMEATTILTRGDPHRSDVTIKMDLLADHL